MASHPILVARGFTRIHCKRVVPAPLVDLIGQFYSLWCQRYLTDEETATLQVLSKRDTIAFSMNSFILNGSEFHFYLQFRCSHHGDSVKYRPMLKATLPGNVVFLCGFVSYDCHFPAGDCKFVFGVRCMHKKDGEMDKISDVHHHEMIKFRSLRTEPRQLTVAISFWVDIKQIKYTLDAHQPNFDELRVPKIQRWKWKIDGLGLEKLRESTTSQCMTFSCDGQWKFLCEGTEKNRRWNYRLFIVQRETFLFPFNVSAFNATMTVKGRICFEKRASMFLNDESIDSTFFDLDWERSAIFNVPSIVLEIEMEIIKVFGLNKQEINRNKWSNYGVTSFSHVHDH